MGCVISLVMFILKKNELCRLKDIDILSTLNEDFSLKVYLYLICIVLEGQYDFKWMWKETNKPPILWTWEKDGTYPFGVLVFPFSIFIYLNSFVSITYFFYLGINQTNQQ